MQGDFIQRGAQVQALDRETFWHLPIVKSVMLLKAESVLGEVQETSTFSHRILCPPDRRGRLLDIVPEGEYALEHVIAKISTEEGEQDLKMYHLAGSGYPRPYRYRLNPTIPLITGQRVIDTFFPLAKGGITALRFLGGFALGKP